LFKKRISSWILQLVVRQGEVIGVMARRLLLITTISVAQAAPLRWLNKRVSGMTSVFETVQAMTGVPKSTLAAIFKETDIDYDDDKLPSQSSPMASPLDAQTPREIDLSTGLPIGPFLADPHPSLMPERVLLEGRFCRLEPLDPTNHAVQLYEASSPPDSAARFLYLTTKEPANVDEVCKDCLKDSFIGRGF
jgi:hypothetical protein